jgi:hypothetical protein
MRPRDTSPEAWAVYLDVHRRMAPEQKIASALSLSQTVRLLAEEGLRRKFPHASEREIFLRRVQIDLGEELFRKAYGAELSSEPT